MPSNKFNPVNQQLWSASISNKQKVTKEDSKFIFEQAEKLLKDTIDTASIIVSRTNTLITILSGIIIGVTAFVIKEWNEKHVIDELLLTSVIGVFYLFLIALYTIRNIQPNSYSATGSLPIDLFVDMFFVDSIRNDDRIIRFYVSEIENYQFRIERNSKVNKARWREYKFSLWAFLMSPIAFILAYLLAKSIYHSY